jgi:hypothetical protein
MLGGLLRAGRAVVSADPRTAALRDAREDNRNEHARRGRCERRIEARVDERWRRRIQAVMANPDAIEATDFPGCME